MYRRAGQQLRRRAELSIIIPALNEADGIAITLSQLAVYRQHGCEVVVVDGGSNDHTVAIARRLADVVICAPSGRAIQMNAGAQTASGIRLCFLHADTVLPDAALGHICRALQSGHSQWGRFDVHLDAPGRIFRIIETCINLRSRWTAVATGDQAIFMTRDVFDRVGGFPMIPLMEDVAISKQLRRLHDPVCIRTPVRTSARRWIAGGIVRTVLLMWWLRLAYVIGIPPQRLARWYQGQPSRDQTPNPH